MFRLEEIMDGGLHTSRLISTPSHGDGDGHLPASRMRAVLKGSPEPNDEKIPVTSPLWLLCGGIDSRRYTWSSLRQSNHDCTHERCNNPPANTQRNDWYVALAKKATVSASTESRRSTVG